MRAETYREQMVNLLRQVGGCGSEWEGVGSGVEGSGDRGVDVLNVRWIGRREYGGFRRTRLDQ
jgi:hypothetical protein